MARSRKQRERKLKAKMHETNVKLAMMKRALSSDHAALMAYIGGVTEFGRQTLHMLCQPHTFKSATAMHMRQAALDRGLLVAIGNSFELTHRVREASDGTAQTTESAAQEPEHGP